MTEQQHSQETQCVESYKDYTLKRWILVGITAFAILFSLISLAFSYLTVSVPILGQEHSLTGFVAIFGGEYPAVLEGETDLAIFLAIVHLGATLGCASLLLDTMFRNRKASIAKICNIVWIILIVPCICSACLGAYYFDYATDVFTQEGAIGIVDLSTGAYTIVIVEAICYIAYALIQKFLPENNVPLLKKSNEENTSQKDVANELKEFKALLDDNAITKEDYDKIKDILLNKGESVCSQDVIFEIKKYKSLLDSNAINQEDYDKIKADLLKI